MEKAAAAAAVPRNLRLEIVESFIINNYLKSKNNNKIKSISGQNKL